MRVVLWMYSRFKLALLHVSVQVHFLSLSVCFLWFLCALRFVFVHYSVAFQFMCTFRCFKVHLFSSLWPFLVLRAF